MIGGIYMLQNLEGLEAQFKDFLNKTIIGASKDYYKTQMKYQLKELQIIDNEDYKEYLKPYVSKEDEGFSRVLDGFGNNYVLNCAIESLSVIERTAISLCFKERYTTSEIAQIMRVREQSVSRIKRRALDKLEMFMKGYDLNG